jgi:hypothetical protein
LLLVDWILIKFSDGSSEPWMVGKAPCMIGKASFSYHASSADELSFNAGDVIAMAPTDKQPYQAEGWLVARKIGEASGAQINGPSPIGLVPSNHFKTLYSSKTSIKIFLTNCFMLFTFAEAKKSSNTNASPDSMPVIIEDPQPSTSSAPTPPSPFDTELQQQETEVPTAESTAVDLTKEETTVEPVTTTE